MIENVSRARFFQFRDVLVRNHAADHHGDVVRSLSFQELEQPRHQRHVRARQKAHADDVDVLLHGRRDYLLGSAVQPGVDDLHSAVAQRAELAKANQEYFDKFGFVFLISASGRSGAEILAELQRRLGASRAQEIRTAAEEQAKILRLRIGKYLEGA